MVQFNLNVTEENGNIITEEARKAGSTLVMARTNNEGCRISGLKPTSRPT